MSLSECANWDAILLQHIESTFEKSKRTVCLIERRRYIVFCIDVAIVDLIMITCPCNVYPLTPHLYIVKLGFTGVCIIFLFLL